MHCAKKDMWVCSNTCSIQLLVHTMVYILVHSLISRSVGSTLNSIDDSVYWMDRPETKKDTKERGEDVGRVKALAGHVRAARYANPLSAATPPAHPRSAQ